MEMLDPPLPIAILGAGPIGLEAALALAQRGRSFVLYEAGPEVGSAVRDWGHVRLFTPWSLSVSPRMAGRLTQAGILVPDAEDACPTGREMVERVLEPVAQLPEIASHLRLGVRVVRVGREGLLKHEEIASTERGRRPFRLLLTDSTGREWTERASAVLDCSGTYSLPNALGDGGIPAPGERALKGRVGHRIPDLAARPEGWAGKEVLLVGAGHSAQTAARDLAALAARHAGTRIAWALRRPRPVFAVEHEALPERGRLHEVAQALAGGADAAVTPWLGVVVDALEEAGGGLIRVTLRDQHGNRTHVLVERILALTGTVGDHLLYRQLQIHECYATSGPMKLAATLLGGSADCMAQESPGPETLKNPEPGYFLLGSKSYGRTTSFLLRVGWQQVEAVMGLLEA
jgi:cation diffusion facilitator CzcD-associated flavoprotein CzcO